MLKYECQNIILKSSDICINIQCMARHYDTLSYIYSNNYRQLKNVCRKIVFFSKLPPYYEELLLCRLNVSTGKFIKQICHSFLCAIKYKYKRFICSNSFIFTVLSFITILVKKNEKQTIPHCRNSSKIL